MSMLLNLVYGVILLACSPWLLYVAIRHGKYRQGWAAKFLGRVPPRVSLRPCIWLHAVSVGEVNLLAPLLARLAVVRPMAEFRISTTTKTGYELACRKYGAERVFYCPLDFSWAVENAMQRIRPDLLVLTELEIWPNLIRAAKHNGARVAVINGRLSERSYRGYRRLVRAFRPSMQRLDLVAAQSEEYGERFAGLGADRQRIRVTGSMKFDGVQTNRSNPETKSLCETAGIVESDKVFIAGSTQAPEEQMALQAFRTLAPEHPDLRLILVPRHPERFEEVATLLDASGLSWQRRSELDRNVIVSGSRILLVDTIGELSAWWGAAHVAFVGGSMGNRGGQNMIEPAAYGAAVSFGPFTHNFRDIVQLMLKEDAAVIVRDGQQMTEFLSYCLSREKWRSTLGSHAQQLVRKQSGATERTCEALTELLGSELGAGREAA